MEMDFFLQRFASGSVIHPVLFEFKSLLDSSPESPPRTDLMSESVLSHDAESAFCARYILGPVANSQQVAILKQGSKAWNAWRSEHANQLIDLKGANLSWLRSDQIDVSLCAVSDDDVFRYVLSAETLHGPGIETLRFMDGSADPTLAGAWLADADLSECQLMAAHLVQADLRYAELGNTKLRWADLASAALWNANLSGADLIASNLQNAVLTEANLVGADLRGAKLRRADLRWANLCGADLSQSDLSHVLLTGANLCGANLSRSDLSHAVLVGANLEGSKIRNSLVYGVSAWDLKLKGAIHSDLSIRRDEPVTVDSLELAQFICLLLSDGKIRDVIDTITSKVVLVLGRFTPERKAVLDAIRDQLRVHNYIPVVFDFTGPSSRDATETIRTLAHMARFVIADITEARSVPQELMAIVPNLPSVPVQPLLLASETEYGVFQHFRRYPWVLEPFLYDDLPTLLSALDKKMIASIEAKLRDLRTKVG
jgi:uncharacterized protein YjbI with pentapeptide repeats